MADTNRSGRVDGRTAAQFLKKSQLRETLLHKVSVSKRTDRETD